MSKHSASLLDGPGKPYTTRQIDTPTNLEQNEVLIKASALAINPVDWHLQDAPSFIQNWPIILGEDVAGTVSQVGDNVTRFNIGDRVIGHSLFLTDQRLQNGGFQEYVVIKDHAVARLPASISFERGCVLPLALSTASAALYQMSKDGGLGLPFPLPKGDASKEENGKGKVIVAWGGSSSVGSLGVQLAKASGVKVVATASKRNWEYVKRIGADVVLDYGAKGVVEGVVEAVRGLGGEFAGVYDAISTKETLAQSAQIAAHFGGGRIAAVLPPEGKFAAGVEAKQVIAPAIFFNEVGKAIWQDWVTGALVSGQLIPAPDALVIGHGLDKVQQAVQKNKDGVSAQKVVVTV